MNDGERRMGKLVLLRRVREERLREAMADALRAEELARSREEAAEDRRRAAADELARASVEHGGERPEAQVLQFRGRFVRYLQTLAEQVEVQVAAMRGERIDATEAAARVRASLAEARHARERFEGRQGAARRDRSRTRLRAEERAQDDAPGPPRPDGPGPGRR